MRRKFIVRKVKEMFAGKWEKLPYHPNNIDWNVLFYSDKEKTTGLNKLAIQATINRIRHDKINIFGDFGYQRRDIPEKACWLHGWMFTTFKKETP